jgi:hypothetical protein
MAPLLEIARTPGADIEVRRYRLHVCATDSAVKISGKLLANMTALIHLAPFTPMASASLG